MCKIQTTCPPTIEIDHRQIFSGVLCAWVGSCILARMYDTDMILEIWEHTMAKALLLGILWKHRFLEACEIDYIYESGRL